MYLLAQSGYLQDLLIDHATKSSPYNSHPQYLPSMTIILLFRVLIDGKENVTRKETYDFVEFTDVKQ